MPQAPAGQPKVPGLQYLAVDAGRVLTEFATGWADLRSRLPMDASATMMAYSMSKTITAAAVLQLIEAQRIGLDDPACRFIDPFPYDRSITVRQLLAHTAGIPNPLPLRWVHPAARHATFDERAALAAVLAAHPRMSRPPGTRFAYSNIGYWLLGALVERVAGVPFTAYVAENVLRPLAIEPRELGYLIVDPDHHAAGYLARYSLLNLAKRFLIDREFIGESEGPWLRINSHYVNGPAFGGLVGTARGFAKFLQDQLRPRSRLFGDAARSLFYEPQRTRNGRPIPMTLGWHLGELAGTPFFFKEGGGGGFHCMMRLYAVPGIASVVMANATGFDAARYLDAADAALLI